MDAFEQSLGFEEKFMKMLSCQLGLSCTDFFDTFMADGATYSYGKFFESKKATNI